MPVRAPVTSPASPPAAARLASRARVSLRAHVRARIRGRDRVVSAVAPRAALDLDALDLGQTLGAIKRKEALLSLPPGKVGLFGARETFEYLADPNAFIQKRVAKYGPVFKTGFFFKPAIVFGSREAVEAFREFEASLPADAALPETFRELHTAYGALRQSGAEHEATRANFGRVLGRAALERYAPILARQTRDFVLGEVFAGKCGNSGGFLTEQQKRTLQREGRITVSEDGVVTRIASDETATPKLQPGYDLRQFCLRSLFELFLGVTPPEALMNEMYAYNEGLLALGKLSPEFEEGKKALKTLLEYVEKHYRTIKAQGKLESDERFFFLRQYSTATDENGEPFPDDRVATTAVLMIWGAYIEAAANMGHVLWTLMRHPEAFAETKKETRRAFTSADVKSADPSAFSLGRCFEELTYCEAVVKETLRVVPQTAGGLRVNPTTRKFLEYDVPAGYVLTADPRVAFLDAENFPKPETFAPERFLDASDPRRTKREEIEETGNDGGGVLGSRSRDPDAYFPGGVGQHKCPGISLSTLMTQIFLVYVTGAFDGWAPDETGEGSFDPEYVQIPIVIIDDKYRLELERNWQYE